MTTQTMMIADVAALVTGHLTGHGLPEPVSVSLAAYLFDGPRARVQVLTAGLAETAGVLLAWAESFPAVTLRAWYPPSGESVHLDVDATLTSDVGSVAFTVYGGVPFDPAVFPGLEPDQERPVSMEQLTAWAGAGVRGDAA